MQSMCSQGELLVDLGITQMSSFIPPNSFSRREIHSHVEFETDFILLPEVLHDASHCSITSESRLQDET